MADTSTPPDSTVSVDQPTPEGIDAEGVTRWFVEHVDGVETPLRFELIAGGHSNLTYSVTDAAGTRFVLRRPPLGQVLASAHDMDREYRIIHALASTEVPVAPARGMCTDETVNGSPFYVMDFVDGIICRTPADTAALSEAAKRRACDSLIEVLHTIHRVDVDAVGLGDLGKREDYIARQLHRWSGQFEKSKAQVPDRAMPDFAAVHDRLAANIPPQTRSTIVHGDYRLDNCILSPQGEVIAVLDWEICTLGDPMADLGLLSVYWADPGDAAVMPQAVYLTEPGFVRRRDLFDHYRRISGDDLGNIGFYEAFGYWKLGCIISGVYARYAGGSMGAGVGEEAVAGFGRMLELIYDAATAAADRM
jgi:aminoglycoside phosphotransferase (APT) family kinase protein